MTRDWIRSLVNLVIVQYRDDSLKLFRLKGIDDESGGKKEQLWIEFHPKHQLQNDILSSAKNKVEVLWKRLSKIA